MTTGSLRNFAFHQFNQTLFFSREFKNVAMKLFYTIVIAASIASCQQASSHKKTNEPDHQTLLARGEYLVAITGCNDCHSPKIMTPAGPQPDPEKLLSGHPSDMPLPAEKGSGEWVYFHMNGTATKGPWGVSYAANLTPDETGIGNWTEEHFISAIKEGNYKGIKGARKLLPPMPWQAYSKMQDDDARAIFTYLKSIKPVQNIVPQSLPPQANK
jgi:hypothetical protein